MHVPERRTERLPVRPVRRWVRARPRFVLLLAAAAFVAWEGVQGRFSTGSHAGILAAIGVVLVLALVSGRGRQRKSGRAWVRDSARAIRAPLDAGRRRTARVVGALVWVLLIGATAGWDATSFTEQKRDLPTLSRLFGDVTDHDWGRALVFAAWVVLGIYLATGWRQPVAPPGSDLSPPTGTTERGERRDRQSRPAPPDNGVA